MELIVVVVTVFIFITYIIYRFIKFNMTMDKIEGIKSYTMILEREYNTETNKKKAKKIKKKLDYAIKLEHDFVWGWSDDNL